jgi:hypothetical protein
MISIVNVFQDPTENTAFFYLVAMEDITDIIGTLALDYTIVISHDEMTAFGGEDKNNYADMCRLVDMVQSQGQRQKAGTCITCTHSMHILEIYNS